LLPLIIAVVFCTIRFASPQRLNVPHRNFWFGPERRRETCVYLSRQGLWLAGMLVGLQGIVWYQLIESNSAKVPQLSPLGFLVTLGIFGLALTAWVLRFFRHFARA
jgi:hypothetical protein